MRPINTLFLTSLIIGLYGWHHSAKAQPAVLDPDLEVRTVVTGLNQPTTMAFIGSDDLLMLEKATGKVQRVTNGTIQSTSLDLAVNFASERGLLGIALHPRFKRNGFVYLYWTESTTGADTDVLAETPLLGNRVDRFVWNGGTLAFDKNIINLRALQPAFPAEPTPAAGRGNHNGGVIAFEARQRDDDHEDDENTDDDTDAAKLYIAIGDVGRRGVDAEPSVRADALLPRDNHTRRSVWRSGAR
jgi:aldose sugar dehydrogenase